MEKMKIFSKGDWIVHVYYGVGQVKGLERKRIDGKDTLYYRVEGDNGTFWIPVNKANTERVRPVASKRKLQKAIQSLRDRPQKVDENYKAREKWIKETRINGSLGTTVCLVRDLSVHDAEKKLNPKEQDTLKDLKKNLIKEWSVVLDINPQEAKTKLDSLIKSHLI